jgi:pimeloyl-ACP methyl ester carboxylesterase
VGFIRLATDRVGIPRALFALTPTFYPWFSGSGHLKDLKSEVNSGSYQVPTLVIQGTKDNTVDTANAAALAGVTHGQLRIVPGVGHTKAYRDNPEAYINRVNTFLMGGLRP